METNLSLGQRVHNALVEAAKLKSEALRLEKLAKRIKAQCAINSGEKSAAMKEMKSSVHEKYMSAEDAWIQAQTEANIAQAEADGLDILFKEWQSKNSTARAEMQLR